MKKSILVIVVAFLVNHASAQWQTNGPSPGGVGIECLTIIGSDIFAGTELSGIYISSNNGSSWTSASTGLPANTTVGSIAASGSNIFAGTNGNGIYLSTNNGGSWAPVSTGLPGGANFTSIVISGSTILAATGVPYGSGVYASTNNGASWTAANTGLPNSLDVNCLAISGSNIYAATESDMYLSTNNGSSWTSINTGLNTFINSVVVNGNNIYAATYAHGVCLSTNSGASWTQELNGLTDSAINVIGVSGSDLIASTNNGLFLSTDNAANWAPLATGITKYDNINLTDIVTSFAVNSTTIFAGTGGNGVWQQLAADITAVKEVPVSPSTQLNLYPNPANNNFTIETTTPGSQQLQLFDLTGNLLITQTIQNSKTTVDASGLAAGVYLVSMKGGEAASTQKLVIAK